MIFACHNHTNVNKKTDNAKYPLYTTAATLARIIQLINNQRVIRLSCMTRKAGHLDKLLLHNMLSGTHDSSHDRPLDSQMEGETKNMIRSAWNCIFILEDWIIVAKLVVKYD